MVANSGLKERHGCQHASTLATPLTPFDAQTADLYSASGDCVNPWGRSERRSLPLLAECTHL